MAERGRERGAALLTVLMLVAIIAVITAVALERLTLSTRMAQNGVAADQGRALLLAGEVLAAYRLADLVNADPGKTTLAGGWLNREQAVPVPGGGTVMARVRDADNCFNLNSLVTELEPETYIAQPSAIAQFATLMRLLGVASGVAEQIAASSADFIDSNAVPRPGGAEDSQYLGAATPYRTAGGLLAGPSELRAVAGMNADIYGKLAPWLCALPEAKPVTLNVNTLLPEQAVLLAMIGDGKLTADAARQILAQRPADGYGSLVTFWAQPALARLGLAETARAQAKLTSRWFEVDLRVDLGGTDVSETALFDAGRSPARLVRRRQGDDG